MPWELLIALGILYQFGFVQILIKKIGAEEVSRTRKLVWQFFFAAMLALTAATIAGQLELSWSVLIVVVAGAVNAFACYCHWRAYAISMARTGVLSSLDDIIAIGLGFLLLNELDVLTPMLATGISVSVICAVIFASNKAGNGSKSLIKWVIGYSGIWGVTLFSKRYFALEGMDLLTFVSAWYVGAWLGALVTRYVLMGPDEAGPPLPPTLKKKVFLLAIAIWTSLMAQYWMRELVPITVIQPIHLVAEMTIPALLGLFYFKERHSMSPREIVVIALAIVCIVLIGIGF